jgi:mannose-6-phosphate isomerase-like protein (cupin superfamily)
MNIAITIVAALAVAAPAVILTGDKALVISAQQVQAQQAEAVPLAKEKGSGGGVLASYGNLALNLSVRTASGGAEIHAHFDDLMIVQQGSATLITGGTVIDAKLGANGETKGSGIKDGVTQTIGVGDYVIVPAGVPHQLLIPPGTTYSALVAKVKEP